MMLFQIEEPGGTPVDDAAGPGVAVGIDLAAGAVAIAVGGNAELLAGPDGALLGTAGLRDGAGQFIATPTADALLLLRDRAERALRRSVTHAVIVAAPPLDDAARDALTRIAAACDITVTRILDVDTVSSSGMPPVLAAAIAAEDDSIATRPPTTA